MTKLLEALAGLDVNNAQHWTSDGLPRLETVRFLSGDNSLTREAVSAAAPGFTRMTPTLPSAEQAQQGTQQAAQAPAAGAGDTSTTQPGSEAPGAAAGPDSAAPSDSAEGGEHGDQANADQAADGAGPAAANEPEESELAGDLDAQVEQARARVDKAQRAAQEAGAALAKAQDELDRLVSLQDATRPSASQSLAEAVQSYHESQKRLLAQRGAQRQMLAQAGIKLSDLLPSKSKLDSALSRKTERGGQRPAIKLAE